jgi:hypothetical protein
MFHHAQIIRAIEAPPSHIVQVENIPVPDSRGAASR